MAYTDPTGNEACEEKDGRFCAEETAKKEIVATVESEIKKAAVRIPLLTVEVALKTQDLGQQALEWASTPRDPGCMSRMVASWGAAGTIGGGTIGLLGFAGGPTGFATTASFAAGGGMLFGGLGGAAGWTACSVNSGGGGGGDGKPELITNPKHHPKSRSPQPGNAKELFARSIADQKGVRWAKDSNGAIHRFSAPSNGQSH